MHDATDYQAQLAALLPPGVLWDSLRQDETAQDLLFALADELARLDERADDLLIELEPRTTSELLAEWEAWAGLPSPCSPAGQSVAQRNAELHAHLTSIGGQSRDDFIDQAAKLGATASVVEHRARRHGDPVGGDYGGTDWNFVWDLIATIAPEDAPTLECAISRGAPAHTMVRFNYE